MDEFDPDDFFNYEQEVFLQNIQNVNRDGRGNAVWESASGCIAVKDMTTEHINHCLRKVGSVMGQEWSSIFRQEIKGRNNE